MGYLTNEVLSMGHNLLCALRDTGNVRFHSHLFI